MLLRCSIDRLVWRAVTAASCKINWLSLGWSVHSKLSPQLPHLHVNGAKRTIASEQGPAASQPPQKVDPAHAAAFVGCYKDGNPYWGGRQHALPLLAGASPDMTVGKCIALCAHAGPKYTLAGVQPGAALQSNKRGGLKEKGTSCYCGSEIGTTCDGCLRGVGTLGDPVRMNLMILSFSFGFTRNHCTGPR